MSQKPETLTAGGQAGLARSPIKLPKEIAGLGLVWQRQYKWAEPGLVPLRRIVEAAYVKGARGVLSWGYSLSFVPLLRGERLVFHKTVLSSRLDVFDHPQSFRASFSRMTNFDSFDSRPAFRERAFSGYVPGVASEAADWFERVCSLNRIRNELERQAHGSECVYRIHHPQPLFVLSFVEAALGDRQSAMRTLTRSVQGRPEEAHVEKFLDALDAVPDLRQAH
jgi:hypothetical protein